MRLSTHLRKDLVISGVSASNRYEVIEKLISHLLRVFPDFNQDDLLAKLREREQSATTGLSCGIAIPHATIDDLKTTVLLVARLAQEIDFGAQDGLGAQILFLILSPSEKIANHVRLLARIARLCSDENFINRMLASHDAQELYQVILDEDQQHV